jgi:hypothetical protein
METESAMGARRNRGIIALFSRLVPLVIPLHVAFVWRMLDQYRLGVVNTASFALRPRGIIYGINQPIVT